MLMVRAGDRVVSIWHFYSNKSLSSRVAVATLKVLIELCGEYLGLVGDRITTEGGMNKWCSMNFETD